MPHLWRHSGKASEHPGLIEDVPAHYRGDGLEGPLNVHFNSNHGPWCPSPPPTTPFLLARVTHRAAGSVCLPNS